MNEKVIGLRNADGIVERYPETSISGQQYEMPPTQVCHLGQGRFCILDIFPPRGFDTRLEVEKLRAALNAVSESRPASLRGKRPDDGTEVENS